jgi:hypothetical protein
MTDNPYKVGALFGFILASTLWGLVALRLRSSLKKPPLKPADTAIHTVICTKDGVEKSYKYNGQAFIGREWSAKDGVSVHGGCSESGCELLLIRQDQCWIDPGAVKP